MKNMLEKLIRSYDFIEIVNQIDNGIIGNNEVGTQLVYGMAIITAGTLAYLFGKEFYERAKSKKD